jgi:hypothetical protein
MIGRIARLVGLLALLTLLGGCASKYEGAFNAALFPRAAAAADSPTPGRVALLVRPQVQDLVYEGVNAPASGVRLPVGRIVEEAVLAAVGDALRGGVQRLHEASVAGAGFDATLVIEAVRLGHDDKLSWIVPIPVFPFVMGDRDIYAQLAFDLSLLDAQGRTVWTRSYDGGRELYKRPSFWSSEPLPVGLVRMAHETAWRLSQQAVGDLREWLEAERIKPREL